MYSISQCLKDIEFFENELSKTQRYIAKLPQGTLSFHKRGKQCYFYSRHPGNPNPEYIPKTNPRKIKQLAYRRYYEVKAAYCRSMLNALEAFRDKFNPSVIAPEAFVEQNPDIADILELRSAYSPDIQKWLNEPHPQNTLHQENLKYKTICGIHVRSKSECMIADALAACGMPFKYDLIQDFGLPGHKEQLSPDFVILHPTSKEIFIWEHFGLMDDPGYAQRAAEKLLLYMESGFIPGKNLIITMESSECPLDSDTVQFMINKYLR